MLPADAEAALVAYVEEACDAVDVEVHALGLAPSALRGDSLRFTGDPCAPHPTLRLELIDGGLVRDRLTVHPSLDAMVRAPVADGPHQPGDPLRWTWGTAPLGTVLVEPIGEAARPLADRAPLGPGTVRAARVPAGQTVSIVVRRGELVLSVPGTLLGDAELGGTARVRNERTRAALTGRLVRADLVEIP